MDDHGEVESGKKNGKKAEGRESWGRGGKVYAKQRETMDAGTVVIPVLSKGTYAPKPEAILPSCVGVGATTGTRALNTDFHPSWLCTRYSTVVLNYHHLFSCFCSHQKRDYGYKYR